MPKKLISCSRNTFCYSSKKEWYHLLKSCTPLPRIKSSTCLLLTYTHIEYKKKRGRYCGRLFVCFIVSAREKEKYSKLCFIYQIPYLIKILEDAWINSIVKVEYQASSSIFYFYLPLILEDFTIFFFFFGH